MASRHGSVLMPLRFVTEDCESERLQSVSDEDGGRFVVSAMAGGSPPTKVVVVHRGQIVVNEAVNVDELNGRRGRIELRQWRAQ